MSTDAMSWLETLRAVEKFQANRCRVCGYWDVEHGPDCRCPDDETDARANRINH